MLIVVLILGTILPPAPLVGEDLFSLGAIAEKSGGYENAHRIFLQCAHESEALRPYALSRAAQNLFLLNKYEAARDLFEQVLREHPEGPWIRLTHSRLGNLYSKIGETEKAHLHWGNTLSGLNPLPWFLTSLAWNRADNALKLPRHASDGYAHFQNIAATTIYIKERNDAAQRLMGSMNPEDRLWAIYAWARSASVTEARKALNAEVILLQSPENTQIPLSFLDVVLASGSANLSDAVNKLDVLLRENRGSMAVRIWLMLALREQAVGTRYAEAEALTDLLIRHFAEGRDAGDACWWIAERYERDGNKQGADRMYRMLADRCPGHVRAPRSLFNLANRAREEDRVQEAFAIYEELCTAHPRGQFTAEAYYRCSQMAARQKDAVRERHYLTLAAGVGEGHFYAHRALHLLHKRNGIPPPNNRMLRAVPDDDFIQPFAPPETKKLSLQHLIMHIPAYHRLKFFGRHGLEEGEWEALSCILNSPESLEKLWYEAVAEAGYMHTLMQIVNDRGWGIENGQPTFERKHLEYPLAYWPEMKTKAAELGIDPFLLLAIARQESTFRAGIVSSAGATGVLQLMPGTANWLVQADSRVTADHAANLNSPINSIHLGGVYMHRMLSRSGNNKVFALASYNAGPGNCDKWRARFPGYSTEQFIDAIPFSETHDYVKKVLANYAAYHSLYPPPGEIPATIME